MTRAVKNRVTTPERKASPLVINGDMNVAQRSTSVTGLGDGDEGYVTVDRFRHTAAASSGRFTSKQTAVTDLDGFNECLELDCTTADTSIAATELLQIDCRMEGKDLQHFKKGETNAEYITVAFYAKADAAVTYICELLDTDNNRHIAKTFTTGTDWTHHVISFPGDTTGNFTDDNAESLRATIVLHAGSNFTSGTLATSWAANDDTNKAVGIGSFYAATTRSLKITGFQIEAGDYNASTLPPFQYESNGVNLSRCQRYFEKVTVDYVGASGGSGTKVVYWSYKVPKRAVPTITEANTTKSGVQHTSVDAYGINRSGDNAADLGLDTTADCEL